MKKMKDVNWTNICVNNSHVILNNLKQQVLFKTTVVSLAR